MNSKLQLLIKKRDSYRNIGAIGFLIEGRGPKIMVLVDGPPGATGHNARFPAHPKLLNHLSTAKFELILDDYNRTGEKSVVDKWIDLIRKRSKNYT